MIVHELEVGAFEVGGPDAGRVGFFGGGEGGEGEEEGGEGCFEKGHGMMGRGGLVAVFLPQMNADAPKGISDADLTGLK